MKKILNFFSIKSHISPPNEGFNLVYVFLFLLTSRVIIFLLPLIFRLLPFNPNKTLFLLNNWNWWDSPHYLYIAENGYTNIGDQSNFIVFLPFFPVTIKLINFVFNSYIVSGIFLSNLFFILGGIILVKLMNLDYQDRVTKLTILLITIFPTSFFFSTPYAESLFFMLVVSSLYLARKQQWMLAGMIGGLATLTRHFGILLLPVLFFEWLVQKDRKISSLIRIFLPFIVALGTYLFINWLIYGEIFAFSSILKNHWFKDFQLPWNGIIQSWKIGLSGHEEYNIMIGFSEALAATIGWILVPLVFFKLRTSYAIFYTLGILMFTSTGFLLSGPRYLLSLTPFFILLGKELKSKSIIFLWSLTSIGLLISLTYLYSIGHWAF